MNIRFSAKDRCFCVICRTRPWKIHAVPLSAQKHAAYVGTVQRVLVDGKSGDSRWPLSARTAGGRLVHLVGDEASIGRFKTAKITDSNTWALFGELTE